MFFKILVMMSLAVSVLMTSFCTSKTKYLSKRFPSSNQSCEKRLSNTARYSTPYGVLIVQSETCVNDDSSDVFFSTSANCGGTIYGLREPVAINSIDDRMVRIEGSIVTIYFYLEREQTFTIATDGTFVPDNPAHPDKSQSFNMQQICNHFRN